MSVVTGALGSLAPKLLQLLRDEYKLQKGVKKQVQWLSDELNSIYAFLSKVAELPWDRIDVQVKVWTREVREASYDMEDVLDTFLVRVDGADPADPSRLKRAMKKMGKVFSKAKARRDIAGAIEDIKMHLEEVAERRLKYRLDDIMSKPASTTSTIDPRLTAMYKEVSQLIGVAKSSDELISMLISCDLDGDGQDKNITKKISVVGVGGLGKTTLAKVVYDKLKSRYECGAFVSIGREHDLVKVFKDILFDLDECKYQNIHNDGRGANLLIRELREFLGNKRYLVVIDDVWEVKTWERIKLALVENNRGSRVITTTRKFDVAKETGEVYNLQPLSLDNSKRLLYTRVFGAEANYRDFQPDDVSNKILKKCAGIPLAIITMSSLLVDKPKDEWSVVYNTIGFGQNRENSDVEDTMMILSFSYYDLPSHLRTCLLYLSAYPEDYLIDKDSLIWKWIAEGFIHGKEGTRLFEVGEKYFNDLINRSMIQAVEEDWTGVATGCRVHDMVLDLIRKFSIEENFIAALDCSVEGTSSPSNARRLAHQNIALECINFEAKVVEMPKVRSYTASKCYINNMVQFSSFKLLRVLDMVECKFKEGCHLEHLGDLHHLRYLGLRHSDIRELPKQIGGLKLLQTLDVSSWTALPASIILLTQLLHVRCGSNVPEGIGKLTSLQELSISGASINNPERFVKELGGLLELRVLAFRISFSSDVMVQRYFVESLRNLKKIQHVSVGGEDCNVDTAVWEEAGFVLPQPLRHLNLFRIYFSRMPSCINASRLPNLSSLYLRVVTMAELDLKALARLPMLCSLELETESAVTARNINASHGFFQKLRFFSIIGGMVQFEQSNEENCSVSVHIWKGHDTMPFVSGKSNRSNVIPVMPNLQVLSVWVRLRALKDNNFDCGSFGFEFLPSLRQVKVYFDCNGVSAAEGDAAWAVLRNACEAHPNHPTLNMYRYPGKIFQTEEEKKPEVAEAASQMSDVDSNNSQCKLERLVIDPLEYMKGAELLGIEEAVNELMKILTEGMSTTQGKIVSIFGLGGLGKTTLAHTIYGKLRAQFDCSAFVSVSQNPNMMNLFKCMLYQLGKKNSANIHEEVLDERLLIYELTEFLQKRRFFIVIDDIRDILVWYMIECALPATIDGCIIITTTRVLDVAIQVGVAYKMRPLSLENSRILLHRRIFGTGDKGKYADDELIEISDKILQRCGGIPLAVIMISGLLASKGGNKIEWDKVYRSMKYDGPHEENMKTIVSLCYENLASHLKPCLLYLSVFPEGYDIDKDRLIRLWMGEGLIQCGKQDESPFELGESYFWELINRCMIQPVYKRWYYDMTECCHVHDMVLDHISEVTGKEKLVSVWNHMHHTFHSQEVQWLSLQNNILDHGTRATMSVVVFPSAVKLLPDLASFRDLLVLDLQSCCLSKGCNLKHLGNLVHLRYLGLRDTGISHLPEEVGNLRSLQTLDVRRNEISSLPATVVELKHLVCLHIDSWTRTPNGIGSFTSLEELSTLCILDSTDIIEELGNLTELRVLSIDCCIEWNVNGVEKSLVECLHKLQKIKTLSISMVGECNLDAWVAPQHLRRLELTGCWPSTVPALLNNPSLLLDLSFLSIEVMNLRHEELECLGRLPALCYLDIEVGNQKLGNVQTFVIGARSFRCLVHCTLRGYIGPVVFQQGAMPEVARLHLVFPVREIREAARTNDGSFDLGFGNLPRLQDVSFLLRRGGASKGEVTEAEAALRQAIESHPNHPTLEIL